MVHRQKHQLPDEPYGLLAAASMARPVPLAEARDVLRAGLSSAKWITVDDTGAHHKAVNGFCTQIGNAHFAWFGTTGSKNRSNFLDLLRAGMTIMSSMPRHWPICTSAPWPGR